MGKVKTYYFTLKNKKETADIIGVETTGNQNEAYKILRKHYKQADIQFLNET